MREALLILVWMALSLSMIISLDIISFGLKRKGFLRFLSTFLFFFGQVITTEFILGALSILTSWSLVLVNVAAICLVIWMIRRKFGIKVFATYKQNLLQSIKDSWKTLRSDPLWMVLGILALLFIIWVIFLGIIFPATDFDGNSYHLTYLAQVMQTHSIHDVASSLPWLPGYPKGGEFIQLWSTVIIKRDFFTDLAQIPFLVLAVYSLYQIAVLLKVKKNHARFAGLLFVFLPIVLNQLKTTYVDVMLTSLFFASLAVLLQKKLSKLDLVLLGALFSLLISVKSTGFLFVAIVAPLLLWKLYVYRRTSPGSFIYNYIKPLLLVAVPTIFGLYWYIKNYVLYGSPIYPFGFKIAGISIFPGKTFQEFAASSVSQLTVLPKGCAQRIWFVWTEQKDWFGCLYNYDANYTGLGPVWFILLIPAFIMSLYFAAKKKNWYYFAFAAIILGVFAVYPANYYSRYTLFITGLGIVALGLTLTYLHDRFTNFIKVIAVILSISVIATNFVLCNFAPIVVKNQLKSLKNGSSRGTMYENIPGPAFTFLEARVKPGELVVYDSKPYFIYPLWRGDYLNKVAYIKSPNKEEWLKELKNQGVDYVFVAYGKERQWAEGSLKSIYKDDMYEIFQTN